jgi:hypothetical protein
MSDPTREGRFFVVIYDQHGGGIPMTDDDWGQCLCLFPSRDLAEKAGDRNAMGRACGYEVHRFGGHCG